MKVVLAVVLISGLVGCGGASASGEELGMDRFTAGSKVMERFAPGGESVELIELSPEELMSHAPPEDANSVQEMISCSSRNGEKDCYCTGSCCRTETTCSCNCEENPT